MKIRILVAAAVVIFSAGLCRAEVSEEEMRKAVVKIFTVAQPANYYQPWQKGAQASLSGSGVIIPGGKIITNAHVIADSVFIQVRKAGDYKKYQARVEYVGHDCEIAMLTVQDREFFEGVKSLEFGPLPKQREKLTAYGFPTGGDDLSVTEGVVSRIEVTQYAHSGRNLLAIQTDAAINPGNSGGPVVNKDGRLVGISFQSFSGQGTENIGYVVPAMIVQRFLKDISDGRYHGVPSLGIIWEKMENDSLKALYGIAKDKPGILINNVIFGSPAWKAGVKNGDVLTAIDKTEIADDGTIILRGNERVDFAHMISMYYNGQKAALNLVRQGKPIALEAELFVSDALVPGPLYDSDPSYFVFGGLVFTKLTKNFAMMWTWPNVPTSFKNFIEFGLPAQDRKEVVIISHVLPHEVNMGYHDVRNTIVESVNGRHVACLKDALDAFGHPQGGFHIIMTDTQTDGGATIAMDAAQVSAANRDINEKFGITSDRSEDLK